MASSQTPVHDDAPHPAERQASKPGNALEKSAPAVQVSRANESAAAGIASRARAEIEVRALMAERHPRQLDQFREKMLGACKRIAFADAALWDRPVGGRENATGLSIRFAEECARYYRNLDISIVVVTEDDDFRVIEAVGVDLEVNVVHRVQAVVSKYVERLYPRPGDEVIGQRTNSRGVTTYRIRANDDAMFTEHQRAAAKAKREVILFFIPSEIREECQEQIERTLEAIAGDPVAFIAKLVKVFARIGIDQKGLEKYLGKVLSQANLPELHMLQRSYNAINQNETTWEELMLAKRGATSDGEDAKATSSTGNGKHGNGALRDVVATKAATIKPLDVDDAAEDAAIMHGEGR